jgi:hypothetical protein
MLTIKLTVRGGVLYVGPVPVGVRVEVDEQDNKERYTVKAHCAQCEQEATTTCKCALPACRKHFNECF